MIKIKQLTIYSILFLLTACALKPIASEFSFRKIDLDKVALNNLGDGDVLVYNGANILHKADNTARLNIWIDNKPLGQIKPNEYVIINLIKGNHQFKALHIDVVNMKSNHQVQIDSEPKSLKLSQT